MRRPIIDPNKSYTFRNYFEMNPPVDELLEHFGYTRQTEICTLPKSTIKTDHFSHLKHQLEAHMRIADLNSEAAKREVLVAPILLNLGVYLQTKLRIEYPLYVSEQLKGKIGYYLHHKGNLLVVEAKNDDLGRGFIQLATELIAFDQWIDENTRPLYGIITIGDAWRFCILDRQTKCITQDIRIYTVPHELQELLQIIIAILNG
ncbi:hypothetical protein QUF63_00910 [Anaerolineales bacterium HSG25]|nr:hypothetical protein [Anaerolineales bacterium HSG25]